MKIINLLTLRNAQLRSCLLALICAFICSPVFSQAGNADTKQEVKTDSTAGETQATNEKKALRMSFEVFKINHEVKLVARVRSKVEAKFQNTAGVTISFYKDEIKPENLIGKDTSNHKGEAYWIIPMQDSTHSFVYWASVQNHPDYEDAEETGTFNPSVMRINLVEEDSSRLVKVFVGHPDEAGKIVPLAGAECKVYVRREFGILPVADPETTDEEGNISVAFPADIHGDESGNVTIIAKVADNEKIGNAEISSAIAWGIPTKVNDFYTQRELWSARANSPLTLIFVVNGALIFIWGFILFIFLEIIKINKLGKQIKG